MPEYMSLVLFAVVFALLLLGFSGRIYLRWCIFNLWLLHIWSEFLPATAITYLGYDDQLCSDCRPSFCLYGPDAGEVWTG